MPKGKPNVLPKAGVQPATVPLVAVGTVKTPVPVIVKVNQRTQIAINDQITKGRASWKPRDKKGQEKIRMWYPPSASVPLKLQPDFEWAHPDQRNWTDAEKQEYEIIPVDGHNWNNWKFKNK